MINKYDKDNIFESGTSFLHYFSSLDKEYPASFFKKSTQRLGDSLIIKSEHYREDKLESTTYYYRVYKNGKIVKEYFPTGNGPFMPVGNPIRNVFIYTYNDRGLPLTMRYELLEYSEVISWKTFRAEYEYY